MNLKKLATVPALAAALGLTFAGPTQAQQTTADPAGPADIYGNATGGDVSGPEDGDTDEEIAQNLAKIAGHPEFWNVDASYRPPLTMTMSAPDQESKFLHVKHFAQINGYFCGPATGKMMLYEMGEGPSNYNGDIQRQGKIGNAAHMQTWAEGATRWDNKQFRRGLNRWREGKIDGWYIRNGAPTVAEFKTALDVTVEAYGRPFAADTVEFAGGAHYNGHPSNRTIGHWIAVASYTNYGARTGFADPSTSVWSGVDTHFSANTRYFVETFLPYNGIVW